MNDEIGGKLFLLIYLLCLIYVYMETRSNKQEHSKLSKAETWKYYFAMFGSHTFGKM